MKKIILILFSLIPFLTANENLEKMQSDLNTLTKQIEEKLLTLEPESIHIFHNELEKSPELRLQLKNAERARKVILQKVRDSFGTFRDAFGIFQNSPFPLPNDKMLEDVDEALQLIRDSLEIQPFLMFLPSSEGVAKILLEKLTKIVSAMEVKRHKVLFKSFKIALEKGKYELEKLQKEDMQKVETCSRLMNLMKMIKSADVFNATLKRNLGASTSSQGQIHTKFLTLVYRLIYNSLFNFEASGGGTLNPKIAKAVINGMAAAGVEFFGKQASEEDMKKLEEQFSRLNLNEMGIDRTKQSIETMVEGFIKNTNNSLGKTESAEKEYTVLHGNKNAVGIFRNFDQDDIASRINENICDSEIEVITQIGKLLFYCIAKEENLLAESENYAGDERIMNFILNERMDSNEWLFEIGQYTRSAPLGTEIGQDYAKYPRGFAEIFLSTDLNEYDEVEEDYLLGLNFQAMEIGRLIQESAKNKILRNEAVLKKRLKKMRLLVWPAIVLHIALQHWYLDENKTSEKWQKVEGKFKGFDIILKAHVMPIKSTNANGNEQIKFMGIDKANAAAIGKCSQKDVNLDSGATERMYYKQLTGEQFIYPIRDDVLQSEEWALLMSISKLLDFYYKEAEKNHAGI